MVDRAGTLIHSVMCEVRKKDFEAKDICRTVFARVYQIIERCDYLIVHLGECQTQAPSQMLLHHRGIMLGLLRATTESVVDARELVNMRLDLSNPRITALTSPIASLAET